MTAELISVDRVGLGVWFDEEERPQIRTRDFVDTSSAFFLAEIGTGASRQVVIEDILDTYHVDDRSLWVEIIFFGETGRTFSSPMNFLELWPRDLSKLPLDVFVDNDYRALFDQSEAAVRMTVRYAAHSADQPPMHQFSFRPGQYEAMMAELIRASHDLRTDLLRIARVRTPDKVESLEAAVNHWPA